MALSRAQHNGAIIIITIPVESSIIANAYNTFLCKMTILQL